MIAKIFTDGVFQGLGNDGLPVALGSVAIKVTSTGVDATTYQDSAMAVTNQTPVPLSASGKAKIFLSPDTYDITLYDQYDAVVWTLDALDYNVDTSQLGTFQTDVRIEGNDTRLTGSYGTGDLSTNLALGDDSLFNVTTGDNNIAIGPNSLYFNTTGYNNVSVGVYSLYLNTTGYGNISFGNESLYNNTTGNDNNAHGDRALYSNISGYNNTAIGQHTLYFNTTGFDNTAVGKEALYSNTTGASNTALGKFTLYSNTSGYSNTAICDGSLYSNTTGYGNNAIGSRALYNNTTGNDNNAIGADSLFLNTTGSNNNAIGSGSLNSNTTGDENCAFGDYALHDADSVNNNAIGFASLRLTTTGATNNAFGSYALYSNTTGSSNCAFGDNALSNNVSYDNTVGIGTDSQVTGSDQVQLGDSATTTYVYGTVQDRSDERDKADIKDTSLGLDFIMSLRPVEYRWDMREDYKPKKQKGLSGKELSDYLEKCKLGNITHDGTHKRKRLHQGFIAQEVMQTNPNFGGVQDHSINGGDDVMSIGYNEFIAPLVKAIQELKKEIDILKGV